MMRRVACIFGACLACLGTASMQVQGAEQLTVASKKFTESVILGEIAAQLARSEGIDVAHERALGGTRILWNALQKGDIDVYPEYTGTIVEEILGGRRHLGSDELAAALAEYGVHAGPPLGFDNSYILGMKESAAAELGVQSVSDLAAHPSLRFGFSNEFMNRVDGWPGLRQHYALPHEDVRGLDHDLAYRGLDSGSLDVIDLYATDAEIRYYAIRPLVDDREFFPAYRALLLYRADLETRHPRAIAALETLAGAITREAMTAMNAAVKIEGRSEVTVATEFLARTLDIPAGTTPHSGIVQRFLRNSRDHLLLVGISLGAAILVAIPLGIAAARRPRVGRVILSVAGVLQTVPSLALLVFMIPLLGIGGPPAIAALFLYSLLPIVRNTHSGLHDIPAPLRESAVALGLPPGACLRLIELPLAARSILSGIKTSAVINVGTATLGALVGAGGYGQPILTGIRLDDMGLILQGAVPAAVLALLVQGMFDLVERWLLPAGLRYRAVR
jgi:osmoprotectant transport system permease protein